MVFEQNVFSQTPKNYYDKIYSFKKHLEIRQLSNLNKVYVKHLFPALRIFHVYCLGNKVKILKNYN